MVVVVADVAALVGAIEIEVLTKCFPRYGNIRRL